MVKVVRGDDEHKMGVYTSASDKKEYLSEKGERMGLKKKSSYPRKTKGRF